MRWTKSFADRNGLSYRKVQQVEDARVKAVTEGNVVEDITRIQAAFNRYNIKSPSQVVNMDQLGMRFKKMVGKSLRKGFVDRSRSKKNIALQRTLDSKGGLDRVTLMPAVSACGKAYTPCVVYPGKQPHYRKIYGRYETLNDVLMPCHLFHNETSAANSEIIYNWGLKFFKETKTVLAGGKTWCWF